MTKAVERERIELIQQVRQSATATSHTHTQQASPHPLPKRARSYGAADLHRQLGWATYRKLETNRSLKTVGGLLFVILALDKRKEKKKENKRYVALCYWSECYSTCPKLALSNEYTCEYYSFYFLFFVSRGLYFISPLLLFGFTRVQSSVVEFSYRICETDVVR